MSPPEVVAVTEPFRDEGRSFLMPRRGVALTPESVIDISHENLIGPGFFRPEGALGVVEARDWVVAQLAWNRREPAKDVLRRLLATGSVELLLTAPAGAGVEEDRGARSFLGLDRLRVHQSAASLRSS